MERELFAAIQTRINTLVPEILFVHIWNNQHEKITDDSDEGVKTYLFPRPALFVEFMASESIEQLGNGVQIYDPLTIRIHLLHDYLDAQDGTMEQNLPVFDLKNKVFTSLQKFEPNGAACFVRTAEEQDYEHGNLYHFLMDFTTNYVDFQMQEPVNGVDKDPPIALDLTTDLIIDNVIVRTGIMPEDD